ncbi:MAG TPA: hypothetical protein VG847_03790 [Chitinophagaceae bacterium]|nr:hypothetical protein [Chitinophagaceae bacterium]
MIQRIYKRICLPVVLCCCYVFSFAQTSSDSSSFKSTGAMMDHGKIYVVMAVCITILAGLFLYLIRIDMKVSKKEKLS